MRNNALRGRNQPDHKKQHHRWTKRQLGDKVESPIKEARQACQGQTQAGPVEKELGYFQQNIKRMQYRAFRKKGHFNGSGLVEAGCKTVIGERCKQSGMFWSQPGVQNILALRCIQSSKRLDDFWKFRLNNHVKRNDPLQFTC